MTTAAFTPAASVVRALRICRQEACDGPPRVDF